MTKADLLENKDIPMDAEIMRVALGDSDYSCFVTATIEYDKERNLILIC